MPGNVLDVAVNKQMESPSLWNEKADNKQMSVLFRMPAGGGALEKNKVREWDKGEGSKRRFRILTGCQEVVH